ncbi:hypothetical protein [Shinella zoogloeoides]
MSVYENAENTPNLTNAHMQPVTSGHVLVRLEYVISPEHLAQAKAGVTKPHALELLITPQQAQKLAEGFAQAANQILTRLHGDHPSKQ